jgi:hypothetical protein
LEGSLNNLDPEKFNENLQTDLRSTINNLDLHNSPHRL